MDNLKTLIDQKKYDLVLKLTERSETANDLFYRISAFIYLGQYENALFVIQDHQKVLESNLVSLINAHINLLCALGRFEQAHAVLDYYSNLPYESQIVEEVLRKMPEVIALEEQKHNTVRFYDDEQIEKFLRSEKLEDVLVGLDTIRNRDIFTFLPILQDLLISHPKQIIRSYILMLLVQKEVDRSLKMKSLDEIIDINPKHISAPFTSAVFNETVKLIETNFKDPTLAQTATQLFSEYEMYRYPRSHVHAPIDLCHALYLISREYINSPVEDVDAYIQERGLNKDKVLKIKKEIDDILNVI